MGRLFHLHSRYACLTEDSIDFVLEHVRDADEVLVGNAVLDARDMIRIARTVLETEQLFEHGPERLLDLNTAAHSDWTLACAAESLAQASVQLQSRGAAAAAERARAEHRAVLRRIVDAPVRSPLVGYGSVLSALMYELKPPSASEMIELQRMALAEDLASESQANVLSLLCELAESYLRLGQERSALYMFVALVRFEPTNIWTHNYLAIALSRRYPRLAHAAATRALLLMPREDKHGLRPQLRRIIEDTGQSFSELSATAAHDLLSELEAPPGKRSRASLRSLCMQIAPEVEHLPTKEPEPLPDSAALAQLRRKLQTLPRPRLHFSAQPLLAGAVSVPLQPMAAGGSAPKKVGRNEPCPCGSDKKWKRCCGAP